MSINHDNLKTVAGATSRHINTCREIYPLRPLQSAMIAGELSTDRWQRDLVQIRCDLSEHIDERRLEKSLQQLLVRHQSLRVQLDWRDTDGGNQIILPESQIALETVNLDGLSQTAQNSRYADILSTSWDRKFNIANPPRLRAVLIQYDISYCQLILTYQETVLDEHSGKMLVQELLELYDAATACDKTELSTAAPLQNYLAWLDETPDTEARHFWQDAFAHAPNPSSPPLLNVAESDNSTEFCCGDLIRTLSSQSTLRLSEWVKEHGATLNTALLAAWATVVAEHSGEDDARFAAVCSLRGQGCPYSNNTVAMCFTVIPFIVRNVSQSSNVRLLLAVRDFERSAHEHSMYFDCSPEMRGQLGNPGAQSLICFDETDVNDYLHHNHPEWTHRHFSLFGRNSYAIEMRGFGGNSMRIQAWYNPRLYGRQTIDCLLDQLLFVLDRLPLRLEEVESGVPFRHLISDDQLQSLQKWEIGKRQLYAACPLQELVRQQVQRTPRALAAIDDNSSLTYEELNRKSNRLARVLHKNGAVRGTPVAICMDRSVDTIVAILAVLKTGAAFVPLDGGWPVSRMLACSSQVNAELIITDKRNSEKLAQAILSSKQEALTLIGLDDHRICKILDNLRRVDLECFEKCSDDFEIPADTNDTAYIIFTSGSTGSPKGVSIQHRPVCNLIDWACREFTFCSNDRVLWTNSVSFDLSVFDIFGILASGGAIRIADERAVNSPELLVELLVTEGITFWNSVPQGMNRLRGFLEKYLKLNRERAKSLRLVFLSGDWIPISLPDWVRSQFENAKVISLGGATEATVWSNAFPVDVVQPNWRSIPYGRPIQNANYYILNDRQRRCAIGIPGELYIGGNVLAAGYANDASLSQERFVSDPFHSSDGAHMYRTGDMARWWPNGHIELLGRLDHQVKVRGYRVELGEIELALRRFPAVRDAVVVARRLNDGANSLIAYLVKQDGHVISCSELRAHLRPILPQYMIPAMMVELETFPLTRNGKIDRNSFPEPCRESILRDRPYTLPSDPLEMTLARIFGKVLGLSRVGSNDNFFELGGDSLSALSVIFAAERSGWVVPMDLLRTASIEVLAKEIKPKGLYSYSPLDIGEEGYFLLSPSQQWLMERQFAAPASYAFTMWLRSAEKIDLAALSVAWQAVNDHHEAMRLELRLLNGRALQRVRPLGNPVVIDSISVTVKKPTAFMEELHNLVQIATSHAELWDTVLPKLFVVATPWGDDLIMPFVPHIITDDYSMRILLEDLGTAYLAAKQGNSISLPLATVPFSRWVSYLNDPADSSKLDREFSEFITLPWTRTERLPKDFPDGENSYAHARDVSATLSTIETSALFQTARRLGVSILSVFVAALSQTLGEWSGQPFVAVDITGTGRDPGSDAPSCHRSVGYFSVIYPVLLQCADQFDAEAIRDAESRLRTAPGRGISYGQMRYMSTNRRIQTTLRDIPSPEIKLNYHGLEPLLKDECPFKPAEIPTPYTLQPSDHRQYLFNLEIDYHNKMLLFAWKYSASCHYDETVRDLADKYLSKLKRVILSMSES